MRGCAQLLNEYSPIAAGFLGVLIPIFEPLGWADPIPGTLLGYQYSFAAIAAIAISAALGLLVPYTRTLVPSVFSDNDSFEGQKKMCLIISM